MLDYNSAENIVVSWGKLYPKYLFDNVRYPVGKIHEDQFVTYKVLYPCEKVAIVPKVLYAYYENFDGITKKGFSLQRYDNVEALEEVYKYFITNHEYELADKANSLKELIIAMFAIHAREYGMYGKVAKKYKMSTFAAGKKIRKYLGYDTYEWFVAKCYPRLIRVQSYMKKIFL